MTIKRDRAGRLWLCFSVVEPPFADLPLLRSGKSAVDGGGEYSEPHEAVTRPVGMDFGLKTFLSLSDGTQVRSPEFFRRGLKEVGAIAA